MPDDRGILPYAIRQCKKLAGDNTPHVKALYEAAVNAEKLSTMTGVTTEELIAQLKTRGIEVPANKV